MLAASSITSSRAFSSRVSERLARLYTVWTVSSMRAVNGGRRRACSWRVRRCRGCGFRRRVADPG